MRCPESWACSTVSGATAVSSPGPSTGREHEQTAGDGGGEAPEIEHALLADSTGRQDGGAQNPPSASRRRRLRDLARGERPPPRRCRAARLRSRTKVWRSRGEQSSCRKVAPRPDARRFQSAGSRRFGSGARLLSGGFSRGRGHSTLRSSSRSRKNHPISGIRAKSGVKRAANAPSGLMRPGRSPTSRA